MKSLNRIAVSALRFYVDVIMVVFFLMVALTGSLVQIEYHMRRVPPGDLVMGIDKAGWMLLHNASAVLFLVVIVAHGIFNWAFVSLKTRHIFRRKFVLPTALSYWLFMLCIPTCLTALASWLFLDLEDQARLLLVEIHDKLGWIFIIFVAIHALCRTGRMARAYRSLSRRVRA